MKKGQIMKNNKLIKIMVCILSLAAIIGVSLGITAFADSSENQSVEIAGYNVSYGGSVSIVYAVKSELNEGQYVKIKGSAYNPVDGTTETFSTKSYEIPTYDIVINGENFGKLPMFYTPGIPLKNMATVVTAEAVICEADGTETAITSGKVTYSVLEYLYQRQFMYAEINTPAQNELYELMLKTGEAVQAALNNYGADHTPSKYAYVNVSGGSFDGKEAGIVLKGDAITLTGNDAGFTVTPVSLGDGYAVEEGTPVTVANGGEYTVDGSVIVTVHQLEGGYYYNSELPGKRHDFTDGVPVGMNGSRPESQSTVVDGVDVVEIVGASSDDAVRFHFGNQDTSSFTNICAVFETDIMFNDVWTARPVFRFRVMGYDILTLTSDIWKGKAIYVPKNGAELNMNTWYNLRFEIYETDTAGTFNVQVYLDGAYESTEIITGAKTTTYKDALLRLNGNGTGSAVYFDNIFFDYVDKAYEAK